MNSSTIESTISLSVSSSGLQVNPLCFRITSSFTRPNDTTPYAANDWISNNTSGGTAFSFSSFPSNTNFANTTRNLIITGIRLLFDTTTIAEAPNGTPALWFYNSVQTFNDNSPVDQTYTNELNNSVARINTPTIIDYGSVLMAISVSGTGFITIPLTSSSLYVGLECPVIFTPKASMDISLILSGYIL
jgi:hypothetical protein